MRLHPSGNLIDPIDPDPKLIDIDDIAFHLSGINRYGGASRLSVAQHCVEMTNYALRGAQYPAGKLIEHARMFAFEVLMHDAAEYILGDMVRPIKHDSAMGALYVLAEERAMGVIRSVFGVTNRCAEKVAELDYAMLVTEQRDLFNATGSPHALHDVTIFEWSPKVAEREFLRLFYLLAPESMGTAVAA